MFSASVMFLSQLLILRAYSISPFWSTLIVDEVCGRTGDFSDGVDPDRTFDENCVITYPCSLSDRPTRVPLPLYPSY